MGSALYRKLVLGRCTALLRHRYVCSMAEQMLTACEKQYPFFSAVGTRGRLRGSHTSTSYYHPITCTNPGRPGGLV